MKLKLKILILNVFLLTLLPVFGYSMTVTFFVGSATLIRDGKNINIKVGDIVSSGDIIKTAKNGTVELLYDDTSKITIKGNTVVQIGNKGIQGSGDVAVISGEVGGKFAKLKKGEHKLGTPTTICAVRGTEFTMGVSKGGDSKIELKEGLLDVRNPYGKVELNPGFSVEADVAGEPVSGKTKGSMKNWQGAKDKSLDKNPEAQADKYAAHIKYFGEESQSGVKELDDLGKTTKKIKTQEDLASSGEKIAESESKIADSMLMNEASKRNIEILVEDYADKNAAIKDRFNSIAEECNKVQEQQMKNYEAIQKVKEEYNKAYEKIMKKFKDDKSNIFKNLQDFKKTSPLKKDEPSEQ